MRTYKTLALLVTMALATLGCSDEWDNHYDRAAMTADDMSVTVYNGTITEYMAGAKELSEINSVLDKGNAYTTTADDGQYTFVVSENSRFDAAAVSDCEAYAAYCVSDISINPAKLVAGSCLRTRYGKGVWVYETAEGKCLDDFRITKMVKATNGYIYYIDGMLSIRQSAYELLESLGNEYSRFKTMVMNYEYKYFDCEHSTPLGVGADGRVVYDSVIVNKNRLLDRYDIDGGETWNIHSESYSTTMFIPTNEQIDNAIKAAMDSIPVWLHRKATEADSMKFEQWIVKACFSDKRRAAAEVSTDAEDFQCIGGYTQTVDEATELTTYSAAEAAWWRPSVQLVDTHRPVVLSNGVAYYCKALKIPNHVVIYRQKARFYQVWDNLGTDIDRDKYFKWVNLEDPLSTCEGQSPFSSAGDLGDWPDVFYYLLTAVPTEEAMAEQLPCTVEFKGAVTNITDDDQTVYPVNLPAGEYYLRMGFKHSLRYSLSIYFNGECLKEDMAMNATSTDFHFDRGSVSAIPHLGDEYAVCFPEGFDPDYWYQYNEKATAYDTDGTTVGVVTLQQTGNFTIRITSNDMARIYKAALDSGTSLVSGNKSNVYQLMMYHWCLRPTHNNY